MSLKRAKEELEKATEKRHDRHMSNVHVRLVLYEVLEILENHGLGETANE